MDRQGEALEKLNFSTMSDVTEYFRDLGSNGFYSLLKMGKSWKIEMFSIALYIFPPANAVIYFLTYPRYFVIFTTKMALACPRDVGAL